MLKIFESYSDYELKPKIEVSDHAFKITLPNVNFLNYEKKNKVTHKYVSKENRKEVIMGLFSDHESIIRKDIEIALNISQATAVLIIR